jgi:hypothetical protein
MSRRFRKGAAIAAFKILDEISLDNLRHDKPSPGKAFVKGL